ncbi:MAG: CCA tRNA nucleotidyltransferase [Lachnospiraceae bacterium]|nr:CCA tRNA nucleotidyltransferase [Lachnospiraceae bacterium]
MRIEIPNAVEEIIGKLNRHGYEAFAVGGCVRDTILGRTPGDWDITTSASPYQVKELFRRTIDTGIQHGTVTIMKDHVGYEVTTYRIDGEYEDGRHPKSVVFTSSLKEDLRRRDFTINAMAYSHETGIVDEFGGMEDLAAGVIRCVGDPMDRFTEDALRILRAIRFSAQLNFSIEPKTRAAITAIAPNLSRVSKERVQVELTKLLLSDHPERMEEVYETGISPYVSEHFHQIDYHRLCISPKLPRQKHIRWAAFLKDEDENAVVNILKDLKLDNDTIARVRMLNRWVGRRIPAEKIEIRRAMSQMEPSLFDDLLVLKQSVGEEGIEALERLTEEIRRAGDCVSLKELAVTGRDLLAAGMKPGKQVGETLNMLLELVLEQPEMNQKELLLEEFLTKAYNL